MANFVLLYSGGGMPGSEAERAAATRAWVAWFGELGNAVVDEGNPFTSVAKTIGSDGRVSDGPVGTMAAGYSIVKADSLNAAVDMAKSCPQLSGGGKISVYETFPAM
jgi:hypothetical protein